MQEYHTTWYMRLCLLFQVGSVSERRCDVEMCKVSGSFGNIDFNFANVEVHFESSRHIASKMRFAMKHNLAGALVFFPSHGDYVADCPIEHDTFFDFKTMEGINLNIPTCDTSFPRIHVVNNAITVSLDEMAQEAQLRKQNDQNDIKV